MRLYTTEKSRVKVNSTKMSMSRSNSRKYRFLERMTKIDYLKFISSFKIYRLKELKATLDDFVEVNFSTAKNIIVRVINMFVQIDRSKIMVTHN